MSYSTGSSSRQVAVGVQLVDAFEGHVGIDGVGPVAAEQAEVHHFAGLAAFHDDARLAPQPPLQQAVVQGGGGQQAGDGDVLGRDVAVAEDQQRGPVLDRPLGRVRPVRSSASARRLPGSSSLSANKAGSTATLKSLRFTVRSRCMSSFVRMGCGSFELPAVLGRFVQQVPLLAGEGHQRHHQPFPQADRWAGWSPGRTTA